SLSSSTWLTRSPIKPSAESSEDQTFPSKRVTPLRVPNQRTPRESRSTKFTKSLAKRSRELVTVVNAFPSYCEAPPSVANQSEPFVSFQTLRILSLASPSPAPNRCHCPFS